MFLNIVIHKVNFHYLNCKIWMRKTCLSLLFILTVLTISTHQTESLMLEVSHIKRQIQSGTHSSDQIQILSLSSINDNGEQRNKQVLVLSSETNAQTVAQEPAEEQTHEHYTIHDREFWINCFLAFLCSIVGGFCSGFAVGMLSINKMELEMMALKAGSDDKKKAQIILLTLSNHHLFLVTLLIANAIALESLPIIVHSLMPDWAAILFSTFVVVIVAEVVPQAFCTGPNKILLAYYACPIILVMIKVFWVVAYPVAKGLDYLVGIHQHERIPHKDFATFLNEDKQLNQVEKILLTSTLELRTERVTDIMIPTKQFYMLEEKQVITPQIVQHIHQKDFSYVLIYRVNRNKIVGIIKIKEFALKYLKDSQKRFKPEDVMQYNLSILSVYSDTNLLEMLMLFQAKSTRIAIVCNQKKKTVPGIQSIMYSKSDMINKSEQAEIIGVVFLYQLFAEMSKFKEEIERKSKAPASRVEELKEIKESNSLNRKLIQ